MPEITHLHQAEIPRHLLALREVPRDEAWVVGQVRDAESHRPQMRPNRLLPVSVGALLLTYEAPDLVDSPWVNVERPCATAEASYCAHVAKGPELVATRAGPRRSGASLPSPTEVVVAGVCARSHGAAERLVGAPDSARRKNGVRCAP